MTNKSEPNKIVYKPSMWNVNLELKIPNLKFQILDI